MNFKSVSQNLIPPTDKMSVKLKVDLTNSKTNQDSFYNIFQSQTGNYLTFNINAAIVIQYKTIASSYDVSNSIRITDESMFKVVKSMNEFYKKLLRKDLFTYYKSGSITCEARRDDKKTISLKTGGFVELEPGVIVDENTNEALPGVFMYINVKENKIDLSIDEFEALLYRLTKVDIVKDGFNLVLGKLLLEDRLEKNRGHINKNVDNNVSKTPLYSTTNMNIFAKKEPTTSSEVVMGGKPVSNTPKSLDDIM